MQSLCKKQPQGVSGVHVLIVSNEHLQLDTRAKHDDALLWETCLIGQLSDFWLAEERRVERWREEKVAAALARVLRTLDGFHAINLYPLHLAVLHECPWEYRNVTADL